MNVSGMTIIQAVEGQTGWRPEELPAMETRVTKSGANLRSGPGVSLPIVAVLKANVAVVVLGAVENGMVPVAACGWVSAELLRR